MHQTISTMRTHLSFGCLIIFFTASMALGQSAFEKHSLHSVAVLPMFGDVLPETARDLLAGDVATRLQEEFPDVRVKNVADSIAGLAQAGQLNDFGNFASLYAKAGVVDSDTAGRIAKILAVESVLFVNVQEYLAQKGKWSRGKSSYNSVRAQCYLLNSAGQPIWRHLVAYVHDPHPWLSAKSDPIPEVMKQVAERIVYALSRNVENSDPKKDIKP